jgi:VWFA-related protein
MGPAARKGLVFLLPGIVTLLAQTSDSRATIRVPVRLVTVPTLVLSKQGRPLPGLQTTDFRVFDNGNLQTALLDTASAPVSAVIAIQASRDVRAYVPFIRKVGSAVETLLAGESGEVAVLMYNDDLRAAKTFETEDMRSGLRAVPAEGRHARMIDAGVRAIAMLKRRPVSRTRILLFIGQSIDSGSESSLASLAEQAEREDVTVYALKLPEFGAAFVSDTFSLGSAPTGQRGGFQAGVDLGNLITVMGRQKKVEEATDPFSVLTAATGGTQIPFRKQSELENAVAGIGTQLRSAYLLSFSPNSTETGFHTIKVEVDVPGAMIHARAGYWLEAN